MTDTGPFDTFVFTGYTWQKEKLHVLSNFFFCHYVFKKSSAADASECVYMRERVKAFLCQKYITSHLIPDI